jgi:hypothetical protein
MAQNIEKESLYKELDELFDTLKEDDHLKHQCKRLL